MGLLLAVSKAITGMLQLDLLTLVWLALVHTQLTPTTSHCLVLLEKMDCWNVASVRKVILEIDARDVLTVSLGNQ